MNLFSYCCNNPINYVDPFGLAKINIKWIDVTIDILLIVIPVVGEINSALGKAGKPSSKIISKISSFLTKYSGKIMSAVEKAIRKIVNKSLAHKIATIVSVGVLKGLSMVVVFSSIGNFIEYIIDCLDGKWDGYLDTKAKLGIHIIWKKGY